MSTELRPLADTEQHDAIALWTAIMRPDAGYFVRYFDSDPWYVEGDCLGAWADGKLVSAVHVCRRPVAWQGETLLMGGIANVATLPDYRGRGLSRSLLRMAIAHMEKIGVLYSALGTGIPGHYAPLGWEIVEYPVAAINLEGFGQRPRPQRGEKAMPLEWDSPAVTAQIEALYAAAPRPLQMQRPTSYFGGWTGFVWANQSARILRTPGAGYLAIVQPEQISEPLGLLEMRAVGAESEGTLLESFFTWARAEGRLSVSLNCIPQWESSLLTDTSAVSVTHRRGKMLRNVSLPADVYAAICAAYSSGQAVWWPGDGF